MKQKREKVQTEFVMIENVSEKGKTVKRIESLLGISSQFTLY